MDELLLDTTYILPIFGLNIELRDFEKTFLRLLKSYSVMYNPISLVEAKWVILKLIRNNQSSTAPLLRAYRLGLNALQEEHRLRSTTLTNDGIEVMADELLMKTEIRDYFDRLIFATATHYNYLLLTEDEQLHEIATSGSLPKPKKIIAWENLIEQNI